MSQIDAHPPGSFCWTDLATSDVEAAASFYMDLFGWQLNKVPMGPDAYYYMFQKDGKDVAAAYQLSPEQLAQSGHPYWLVYYAVADVDDVAGEVAPLGGTVIDAPFDVYQSGRMAIAQEPSGAVFGLWQPGTHIGAQLVHEHGAITWAELSSRNFAASEQFLAALFGWDSETMSGGDNPYVAFKQGDQYTGGLMPVLAEWGNVPAHWLVYFHVDDCDRVASDAAGKGATLLKAPEDAPGVGRFAVVEDPQGAVFAVLQPAPGEHW